MLYFCICPPLRFLVWPRLLTLAPLVANYMRLKERSEATVYAEGGCSFTFNSIGRTVCVYRRCTELLYELREHKTKQ